MIEAIALQTYPQMVAIHKDCWFGKRSVVVELCFVAEGRAAGQIDRILLAGKAGSRSESQSGNRSVGAGRIDCSSIQYFAAAAEEDFQTSRQQVVAGNLDCTL